MTDFWDNSRVASGALTLKMLNAHMSKMLSQEFPVWWDWGDAIHEALLDIDPTWSDD